MKGKNKGKDVEIYRWQGSDDYELKKKHEGNIQRRRGKERIIRKEKGSKGSGRKR